MAYRNIKLPEGHTWRSYTEFLLNTLPKCLRKSYVERFNTSIKFWHETGGGLSEETIMELINHGYNIKRNGISNYTLDKKSRIIFVGRIPDDTDDILSTRDIPSWNGGSRQQLHINLLFWNNNIQLALYIHLLLCCHKEA